MTHKQKLLSLPFCGLIWLLAWAAPVTVVSADERPAGLEKALKDLQERVNQQGLLNGIFLKDAYLNARGELVLKGFWPRCDKQLFEEQTKRLEKLITDYGKTDWTAIREVPRIDFDQMDRVTNLLDQLQQEAAKQQGLRDVLFSALKYDGGHLRFEVVQGGSHSKEELEQFVGTVLTRGTDWQLIATSLSARTTDRQATVWSVRILETFSFREFVSEVQAEIAHKVGLDGVFVDNMFFNERGNLALEGIRPPAPQAGSEDLIARQLNDVLAARISSHGEKWGSFTPADL